MPTSRKNRSRTEVTKEHFEKMLSEHPEWTKNDVLDPIITVYIVKVKQAGLVWNKPVAYAKEERYYIFND